MSASSKKKLRKEQNAAAMTEKQQNELKEAKKLKTYTLTFIIVMALVVATVAGIVLRTPVTGLINNNTVAVTIGDHQLTSTQLNYFYSDAISELYSSYYNYYGNNAYLYAMIYEGVNFNAPLDEQTYDKETGATWADHFIDEAIKNAASVYTMYDLAMADESFKLTEDDLKSIDNADGNQELYANLYGYSSLNAYLRATYGAGSTEKTYTDYYTVNYVASAYYEDKYEALDFKDADFREFEKDKFHQYSSFTYSTYYVNVTSYREGGTKDDKGNVTYSDAELKAAEEAAKKDADSLAGGTYADLKALNAAIISLEINKKNTNNSNNKAAATEYTDVLLNETNVSNKDIREWLGGERKANDVTSIEVSTTSKDENGKETKTVNGYYIVMYHSHKDNKILLPNVRHVLLKPEGGTYNSTTGTTVYTDAARAAVKIKAQPIKTVRLEQSFEGMEFVRKIGLGNKGIDKVGAIKFNGCGIVIRGHLRTKDPNYVGEVEITIDGKKMPIVKLPGNNHARSNDLYWNFDLEDGDHVLTMKRLNPEDNVESNVYSYLTFKKKAK